MPIPAILSLFDRRMQGVDKTAVPGGTAYMSSIAARTPQA